jgi:hypothetical protein
MSSDATDTFAIITDRQPAYVWNWWYMYSRSQFGRG